MDLVLTCPIHGQHSDFSSEMQTNGSARHRCRICTRARNKARYWADPVKSNQAAKAWRQANPDYLPIKRLDCLEHYSGGTPSCAICGDQQLEFLALDHIRGGGQADRRNVIGIANTFKWLVSHDFPPGFRVLCHNCHHKHGARVYPKRESTYLTTISADLKPDSLRALRYQANHPDVVARCRESSKRRYYEIKAEVLRHYGGACACCGITDLEVLSIDHTNGGGRAHDRELRKQGTRFGYEWLKRQGFPTGYRALCFNCNVARGLRNGDGCCPHERARRAA